jgi:DNA invertase Pin-like site-specific DNA recombinase
MALPSPTPRFIELVRVSGSSQAAKDTPADQRAALDRLRASRPGVLVERIEEGAAGLSGALPLDKRPDLQRLVALAKRRAFDEVRVRHLDRLTRHPDPRERYAIFGAVADAGAVIVDAGGHVIDPASEMGELDFAFQTIVAARERARIRERTVAARKRLADQGKLQGRPPYGRTWDKVAGAWGENADQMKVYRRIFGEVLAGRSLHAIAAGLQADRVPTPGASLRGKGGGNRAWTAANVGHLVKHRSAVGEARAYGNVLQCPPVVDRDTFERASKAIKWTRAGRPPLDESSALLRKIAICGSCGSPIWVVTGGRTDDVRLYYACRWRRTARTAECRRHHAVAQVDALAREALLAWLARDVVPKAGKRPDPAKALEAAEARVRELDQEEARVLRVARQARPEVVEKVLAELAADRQAALRELEAAKLATKPVRDSLDHKRRAIMLRAARGASAAELRRLVQAALRPGDVRILPGPRVEIRATRPLR